MGDDAVMRMMKTERPPEGAAGLLQSIPDPIRICDLCVSGGPGMARLGHTTSVYNRAVGGGVTPRPLESASFSLYVPVADVIGTMRSARSEETSDFSAEVPEEAQNRVSTQYAGRRGARCGGFRYITLTSFDPTGPGRKLRATLTCGVEGTRHLRGSVPLGYLLTDSGRGIGGYAPVRSVPDAAQGMIGGAQVQDGPHVGSDSLRPRVLSGAMRREVPSGAVSTAAGITAKRPRSGPSADAIA